MKLTHSFYPVLFGLIAFICCSCAGLPGLMIPQIPGGYRIGEGSLDANLNSFFHATQKPRLGLIATGFEVEQDPLIDEKPVEIAGWPIQTKYLHKMKELGIPSKTPPEASWAHALNSPYHGDWINAGQWFQRERFRVETGDRIGTPLTTAYVPKAHDIFYQWMVEEADAQLANVPLFNYVPKDQLKLNSQSSWPEFSRQLASDNQLDGFLKVGYIDQDDPLNFPVSSILQGEWMVQVFDAQYQLLGTFFVEQGLDFGGKTMESNETLVKAMTPDAPKDHLYRQAISKLVHNMLARFEVVVKERRQQGQQDQD